MGINIAIVGATGNVGLAMLRVLETRKFPVGAVYAVASSRSAGVELPFCGNPLVVQDLEGFNFSKCDIALFSAGGEIAKTWAPKAAEAGCIVVDNSSAFRMEADVPLIVPEVNAQDLEGFSERGIIANPNCSTIQMVVALKPLAELSGIKRVVVSTYQSVSGAGKAAVDALREGASGVFPKPIAHNCIPQVDVFLEDGQTREEWKMSVEADKILGSPCNVHATCVRVPVFDCHAESVNVEFEGPVDLHSAAEALKRAPGIVFDEEGYTTQVEAAGRDAVCVSRLRVDPTVPHGLSFWCVSDNLRKGAATNAVQIAELLLEHPEFKK